MEKYTVLMSVYAKENALFFQQAVQSMVEQTLKPDQFIIVCDGPLTDELNDAIDHFTQENPDLFTILRKEKNSGLADSLNSGLSLSKNELVVRMDSDDISSPVRCEKEVEKITEGFDLVGSWISEFETDPKKIYDLRRVPENQNEIIKFCKKRTPFNHPSVIYKKTVVQNSGGYPSDWKTLEDYYLFYHMLKNGAKVCNIPETLVNMRGGSQQLARRGKMLKSYSHILRKEMFHDRFISFNNYCFVTLAIDVGYSLPVSLKKLLYKMFLRKKIQGER